jgi:hypothetical protein
LNAILSGLSESEKEKVGQCTSAKELWEKLQNAYSEESLLSTMEAKHVDQEYEDDQKEEPSKGEVASKETNESQHRPNKHVAESDEEESNSEKVKSSEETQLQKFKKKIMMKELEKTCYTVEYKYEI